MSPAHKHKFINPSTTSKSSDPKHRVCLEYHGEKWEGRLSALTEKTMGIIVEGFIPTTISQGVTFSIGDRNASVKLRGKVKAIGVEQNQESENGHEMPNMKIQITLPQLDEFTFYKLKGLLGPTKPGSTHPTMTINFFTEQINGEALENPSSRSSMISANTDLPELAKAGHPKLTSTLFDCKNGSGKTIVGYHDQQEEGNTESPVVILAPGYGETKREYITLAYYLANNGFHVLRYDHTHHVGESEGSHESTSLTNMKQDMIAILDYAKLRWRHSSVALVATSLAGRVALKAVAEGHHVDQLIVINGIVDVRSTLTAVHQEDLIGGYLAGKGRGVTNVLGFNVDGRTFLKDAVEGGFSDLAATIQDAKLLESPVTWFAAEQDSWVEQESYQQVIKELQTSPCRPFVIPEGLHRLQENPRQARAVYRQIVFACQELLGCQLKTDELLEPSRKDIGQQNRIEREKNQIRRFQHEADHVDFWTNYLSNFHYIANSHDYMAALDHIYHLLGPVTAGDRILDAGCGNGHFGSFLLAKEWTRRKRMQLATQLPIQYVGVDFVEGALKQATGHLQHVLRQADPGHTGGPNPSNILQPNFYRLDLNSPLPFKDGSFDRIMSNLVIGYLRDPAASIRELLRVLAPGGKLVLTNLKPSSDLTQIYRNYVDRTTTETEIHEAREVLNNSSHIRQGESEGAFQFYTQEEFRHVLKSCGAENPVVFPTFGNQAFIGVVEKPVSQAKEERGMPYILESLLAA